MVFDKPSDLYPKVFDAGEGPSANCLSLNDAKPRFDLVEPRCIRGGVVGMLAWPLGEPIPHCLTLVGAVVVYHQMDFQFLGNVLVDVA